MVILSHVSAVLVSKLFHVIANNLQLFNGSLNKWIDWKQISAAETGQKWNYDM